MNKILLALAPGLLGVIQAQKQKYLQSDNPNSVINTIRKDLSVGASKVLAGFVISCLMIYSLIQLGELLKAYINQFENREALTAIIFGIFATAGGAALYIMFIHKKEKKNEVVESQEVEMTPSQPFEISHVLFEFIAGFKDGLRSRPQYSKSRPIKSSIKEASYENV